MSKESNWLDEIVGGFSDDVLESQDLMAIGYLLVKAKNFLEVGPIQYAEGDALSKPSKSVTQGDIDGISKIVNQICAGKGFDARKGIKANSLKEVVNTLDIFHFSKSSNKASFLDNTILDRICFEHLMDSKKVCLYFEFPRRKV